MAPDRSTNIVKIYCVLIMCQALSISFCYLIYSTVDGNSVGTIKIPTVHTGEG